VVAALSAYAYLWTCRRVGARARTFGRPSVVNGGNVELGDDVVLDSREGRIELAAGRRGRLAIGHGVRVGPSTRILAARYVEVGDGSRIGANCVVSDAGPDAPEGSDVWIGDGVTLGDGVRVLPGTVIGAGASVAPGTVVSGRIPAGAHVVPGTGSRR
jgi:acetyltransferase-like isoleucine patch superfamily enzyme